MSKKALAINCIVTVLFSILMASINKCAFGGFLIGIIYFVVLVYANSYSQIKALKELKKQNDFEDKE